MIEVSVNCDQQEEDLITTKSDSITTNAVNILVESTAPKQKKNVVIKRDIIR
jgi:hypothetical protein